MSEAVLVRGGEEVEGGMAEFAEEGRCRRVVLDTGMDGRTDRVWCEEGEVRCDTCERREALEAAEAGDECWGFEESKEEAGMGLGFTAAGRAIREGQEAAELRRLLEEWAEVCMGCWLAEAEDAEHRFNECLVKGECWERVRAEAGGFREGLFGAWRLGRFSGCFYCGIPQEWCESWRAEGEDGGRYRRTGGRCQYKGVLETVIMGFWLAGKKAREVVRGAMERDGVDTGSREAGFRWFGRKIRWGGLKTNNACRVFYMLNKAGEE